MAKLNIASFLCGTLFSVGLGISGMTQPEKVIGFLDVLGEWDLSLAFVMCGAVLTYLVLQLLIQRKFPTPLLEKSFQLPKIKDIDRSLIIGSLLFGSGWGLGGYCPGPGITSLGSGSFNAIMFVFSMGVGMLLADRLISPMLRYQVFKN